jgi:uncharacterized membrane protein
MSAEPASTAVGVEAVVAAAPIVQRQNYVDVFRGLLIAHMALDHTSLMYNAGRRGEELAALPPDIPTDILQFLTRFTGVPVAPAFCFMAGFMVALTSMRREERGVSPGEVTRRLVIRGLVLIAVDAVIMGLPRAAMGFYSFMVLTCIGVSIIMLALVRHVSSAILLPVGLAVLALHPLIDVSALPVALRAILYEPVRTGAFRSMYPLIPWSAIVLVGFVAGRDAVTRKEPVRLWMRLAGACLFLFFAVRLSGGYGNAFAYENVLSREFWFFAKYPPDLPFLTWSFAIVFVSLSALWLLTRRSMPTVLRPLVVFGRVPFFFYVVHFYILGIGAALLGRKLDLFGTFGVWLLLLVFMTWPCAWYYRKKRDRPNFITLFLIHCAHGPRGPATR